MAIQRIKMAEEVGDAPVVQRLWLVRHGTTQWNQEQRFFGHSDVPLSAVGEVQARWLADALSLAPITTIYSSDLVRASRTAEIIAGRQRHAVSLNISPLWRELSFGLWEGLTYPYIAEHFKHDLGFFTDPFHYSPPGGEQFSLFVQRVQDAFLELVHAAKSGTGDIVLVSHAGVLRVLLCYLLMVPFERQWQFRVDPGSLSALDFVLSDEPVHDTVSLVTLNLHSSSLAVSVCQEEPSTTNQSSAEGSSQHV